MSFYGYDFGKDLSPKFKSIYDCQDWIDKNCQVLLFLFRNIYSEIDKLDNKFVLRFGNSIRCWNTSQNRWADGFDY